MVGLEEKHSKRTGGPLAAGFQPRTDEISSSAGNESLDMMRMHCAQITSSAAVGDLASPIYSGCLRDSTSLLIPPTD